MPKNGSHITEMHLQILDIIGEDNVEALASVVGCKKISLIPLKEHITQQRILKAYQNEPEKSIADIAKENGVNRSTVYRILKISLKPPEE